jgi:hypothetical protein
MGMAILQFFKNKYRYPKYSESLVSYGSPMDCTPVGVNLRSGSLRVKGEFTDFMSCNYLSLQRDGKTIYAWIDDVRFRTEDSFEVAYTVDAWRTYKGHIDLATQFIKRSPQETFLKDHLLGSIQPYVDIDSVMYQNLYSDQRVMVVQVRGDSGSLASNAPVQPTPYQFYLIRFDVNDWQSCTPLVNLMSFLSNNAETQNLVTAYSIPFMSIDLLPQQDLVIKTSGGNQTITGFKCLDAGTDASGLLYIETPITIGAELANELYKTEHSVQIVIPEAGIISIPDELLNNESLKLRQDIDLFSGASNYMLVTGDIINGVEKYYSHSVRGSSISSIPIISDPMDTYLSQNQNGLATSLIGDVASIAMGAGLIAATGGVGAALGGGASIAGGVNGLMNTAASIGDAGNHYSNPPAFLGTALAANFNQRFWVVTKKLKVTNEDKVRSQFGYPYNMIDDLAFPAAGYIQTESCNVESDGSVPRWALDEINHMFDSGVLVK